MSRETGYRDFSDMSADEVRDFANALTKIARNAQEKELRKRRRALSPPERAK
jgi:hypothetical protein